MLILSESQNKFFTQLIPRSYIGIHTKLKELLDEDEFLFFARPEQSNPIKTTWISDIQENINTNNIRNFSQLSEEEQGWYAGYIENLKSAISEKLIDNKDFKDITDKLFRITDEKDIFLVRTESGNKLILTKWGCKSNESNSNTDPIRKILSQPKPDFEPVNIQFFYTDGTRAMSKTFSLSYKKDIFPYKSDKAGNFSLGAFKPGTEFAIFDILNNQKIGLHQFTVTKGNEYKVIFPFFTKAIITVIDEENKPYPNKKITIRDKGNNTEYDSGKLGYFTLENLEAGNKLTIFDTNHPENTENYKIERTDNKFFFVIKRPEVKVAAKITVVDENDLPYSDKELIIEYKLVKKEYLSNTKGEIRLEDLSINSQLIVCEKNNIENIESYSIEIKDNDFIFRIKRLEPPAPQFVKIKVVDHKNNPIINTIVDFEYNGQTLQLTTNTDGICELPQETFVDGEKVKAIIHLLIEKKAEKWKIMKFKKKN